MPDKAEKAVQKMKHGGISGYMKFGANAKKGDVEERFRHLGEQMARYLPEE